MGWVEDTNNAPTWAHQRCSVGWKGAEHQQRAHLGTQEVFGRVEGSRTPQHAHLGTLLVFSGEGMQPDTKTRQPSPSHLFDLI